MTIDHLAIPAMYRGTPDATLTVATCDAETYAMELRAHDKRVIARADGFRPGAGRDFGADAFTAATFGGFLAAALEAQAYSGWDTIADDASDWADALAMMEYDECEARP